MKIKCSEFVKRQTRTSDYSYFNRSWEDLELITKGHFNLNRQGYRDGVILVTIPHQEGFFSSVVKIDDSIEFETVFEARREGEKPYKKSIAYGTKTPAKHVDIVLYRKDVLEEDPTNAGELTGADWEIVSINCSPYDHDIPMTPVTKARNILACTDHPFGKGGSCDTNSTAIELAECVAFWSTHTTIREK